MSNAAKAADVADKILDAYISWLSGLSVSDWVQKQMKISKGGALTSFLLTTLQTGNVAHITRTEFDTGSGGGTFPWTDNALHPIIPALIVGAVMMAVDLIPQTAHQVPSHPAVTDPPVEGQGESKSWSI